MNSAAARRRNKPTLEERVESFRALVYLGVQKAAAHGHALRPYEGALALHWPPFVHLRHGAGRFSLHLSCSVLGGETSHFAWRGRTWGDVFRKASADVEFWISQINGGGSK